MNNPNEPAFPAKNQASVDLQRADFTGMTKREFFTAMAMLGIIQSPIIKNFHSRSLAAAAVEYADKTLAELEEKK